MDLDYNYTGTVAGVDEAGRGPLAGAVVAAAVVLPAGLRLAGLNDSKKLTEKRREALYELITAQAHGYGVGVVTAAEIDQINILQATLLAMQRAVEGLSCTLTHVLVDGNQVPSLAVPTDTVIKGDQKIGCIAAASIIAKVTRDRMMLTLDAAYPEYGFAGHKGYGTKKHLAALQEHGPCPEHRRSFAPVRRCSGVGARV